MAKKIKKNAEEVEKKEQKLEDQLKRILADYQNLEKRVAQEKEELKKSANRELILRFLPALDTLILTDKHTQDEGLKLSIKHIFDTLEKEGLKKIEAKGQDFNPEFMEAVHVVQGEEGKVIEELRTGYFLNDKVLRPAQVVVGRQQN